MYLRKSLPIVAISLIALAVSVHASFASRLQVGLGCSHPVTAKEGLGLAEAVWSTHRWMRGAPKPVAVAAHRRQVRCAAGPGHRAAIQHRWEVQRAAFYRERHRCRGGTVVEGHVSVFGGGLEASGHYTSEPGIALNIDTSSEPGGWNNSTTRGWLERGQRFWVTIEGHRAILPVTDLGPASWVSRSIDVTEGGAVAMGLSVSYFPTDSIGRAQLIPDGCL
jgi:hypothetical protein